MFPGLAKGEVGVGRPTRRGAWGAVCARGRLRLVHFRCAVRVLGPGATVGGTALACSAGDVLASGGARGGKGRAGGLRITRRVRTPSDPEVVRAGDEDMVCIPSCTWVMGGRGPYPLPFVVAAPPDGAGATVRACGVARGIWSARGASMKRGWQGWCARARFAPG